MLTERARRDSYEHRDYERRRRLLRWLMAHLGWPLFAKIDTIEGVDRVPSLGPAILVINHIAMIDPIAVLGHLPRNVIPVAKRESSRVPFWGIFATMWHVIEVRRDGSDQGALLQALSVLAAGEVVLIAPEGTRSPAMRRAHAGVAYLAAHSAAPVVPVAVDGTEGFPTLKPGRRAGPGVVVRFGRPLRMASPLAGQPSRELLQSMTSEIMGRIAAMLPEPRRGVYAENVSAPLVHFHEDA
jgi:1-acyl-sn-glycerol-3-phosphate acyltransferase